MSATITAKLNKAASIFQAGESTGFGISLGERYYDRGTKAKEWTNYKAVIFAKIPAQVKFLTDALIEGAVVSVTCKQQKIDVYEGQQGQSITIEMIDASVQFISYSQQAAPQAQQAPSMTPQHPPHDGFEDSSIPF